MPYFYKHNLSSYYLSFYIAIHLQAMYSLSVEVHWGVLKPCFHFPNNGFIVPKLYYEWHSSVDRRDGSLTRQDVDCMVDGTTGSSAVL